jgi:hypothetical protein
MNKLTFLAAIAALGLGAVAFAQDAAPTSPKPQQRPGAQGRNTVQVCAMKGEALKMPAKAETVEFNGKKVLFCCTDCKAAFEKLDDAAKTKTVTKAGLISRKLTAQKTIEQVDKQLKQLEAGK